MRPCKHHSQHLSFRTSPHLSRWTESDRERGRGFMLIYVLQMFPSIFPPLGVHILSISFSPLRIVYCWHVFLSMICDKDRWEQGSGVCSDFWMKLFWYFDTCIVKKCLVTAICLVRLFQILLTDFFLCVPQKKAGEVAFFHIQWMSVGIKKWALVMSIWLPTF